MGFTADEHKDVHEVFKKINKDTAGGDALSRLLVVHRFTRRHFANFGDLSTPAAVLQSSKVVTHGKKVLNSIIEASDHMDDLSSYYKDLSAFHCLKLHVDPNNFHLFADMLSIVFGIQLNQDYTAHRQASMEKYLSAVGHALSKGYH